MSNGNLIDPRAPRFSAALALPMAAAATISVPASQSATARMSVRIPQYTRCKFVGHPLARNGSHGQQKPDMTALVRLFLWLLGLGFHLGRPRARVRFVLLPHPLKFGHMQR